MATSLINSLGLVGLFIAAFLAASLLPFPVEAAVPAVVALGHSTGAIVIAGTVGGYLGSLVNYFLARRGAQWIEEERPRRATQVERVRRAFGRFGSPLLVFSWLPVVGELITVAAGVAGTPLPIFSAWTIVGRALRMYGLVTLSLWLF